MDVVSVVQTRRTQGPFTGYSRGSHCGAFVIYEHSASVISNLLSRRKRRLGMDIQFSLWRWRFKSLSHHSVDMRSFRKKAHPKTRHQGPIRKVQMANAH